MNSRTRHYVARSPECEHLLDPTTAENGLVTCPCPHSYDVRWVEELGWLQARSEWVTSQMRAGKKWFDSRSQSISPVEAVSENKVSGSRVLYVLGGVSLVTAVAVFIAVSWRDLSAIGQLLIAVSAMVLSGFGAYRFRASLAGLANTCAAISTAVAALLLLELPNFGVVPESWNEASHPFSATALMLVAAVAWALGTHSRVLLWTTATIVLSAPTYVLLIQNVVPEMVNPRNTPALSMILGSVLMYSLYLLGRVVLKQPIGHSFTQRVSVVVIGFLALTTFPFVIELATEPMAQFSDFAAMIVVVAMWFVIARHLRDAGAFTVESGWERAFPLVTPFVTAFVAAGAIVVALEVSTSSTTLGLWMSTLIVASIGSIAYLRPAIQGHWDISWNRAITVFASALWLMFFISFNSKNSMRGIDDPENMMAMFFAVIAASGLARWVLVRHVSHFVVGVVAGVFAVITLVNVVLGENISGPEEFSLPTALWIGGCLWAFKARSMNRQNSAVWLGIPLAVGLLPSAVAAVPILEFEPDNRAWVRFWTVLVLGVSLTIAGSLRRVSGLLWPGVATYLAATVPQLFIDLEVIVPRWIFFALLGGYLLWTAARFEKLQHEKEQKGTWSDVFV